MVIAIKYPRTNFCPKGYELIFSPYRAVYTPSDNYLSDVLFVALQKRANNSNRYSKSNIGFDQPQLIASQQPRLTRGAR